MHERRNEQWVIHKKGHGEGKKVSSTDGSEELKGRIRHPNRISQANKHKNAHNAPDM
jgi:hypothetical protein